MKIKDLTKNEQKLVRIYRILHSIQTYLESRNLQDEISNLFRDCSADWEQREHKKQIDALLELIQSMGSSIVANAKSCKTWHLKPFEKAYWMYGSIPFGQEDWAKRENYEKRRDYEDLKKKRISDKQTEWALQRQCYLGA